MYIYTPLVSLEGIVQYPQGVGSWENARIINHHLVGNFSGDLYLGDGETKAFTWEFYKQDDLTGFGTKITKLAFLNRLGDAALISIEAASRVDNLLGVAAAVIKVKHASSTYIDLSLPETASDIQKLVDYGFITQDKKISILSTPVQEKEVPIFISTI
jgi:hypothetical protein